MALADTARLIASLELQDKFTATANKFDSTLGRTEKRLQTLERVGFQVGRGARNAVDNIKTIGVVAGTAIASQVALGVKSLQQLEEVKNQTDAVIASTKGVANVTADEIRKQAEALEDLTTVDDKAIQAGENMLLTFTNIRNEAGEGNDIFNQATKAVVDLSVAMGTEPKQAALQLGKALNDPVRGLTALRRVGIQFTDQQEKQIRKMVDSGKTLEAQKLIIAELNKEFGKSGEAFGKGPGATMRRFGDAVEGAQQALARGFLPVMEKVSDLVQTTLKDPKVIANIEKFGEGLAGGVEDLIDIGMNLPWDAIGNSAKLMGQGAKALLDAFTGLPPWVQTAVLTGWGLNKLTGGALGNIAGTLTKAAFGAIRGSTPATPVFTKEVGVGGVTGGGAGGGASLLGRVGGVLGFVGIVAAAVEGLHELEEAIDGVGFSASKEGHSLLDDLFGGGGKRKEGAATPIGQFNRSNQGGVQPVRVTNSRDLVDPAVMSRLGDRITNKEEAVRRSLERGDIHHARMLEKNIEALHQARGTIRAGFTDVVPKLGAVNRALSTANRNLDDGNARQRETAQRVAEARDRIGNGFQKSNEQLGVIAGKDFSPNVAVSVTANTSVSISEVTRAAVSNSFASGFTPGLLNG